ncbi:MAG TPA: hypothetical protein DD502_05395, partial [Cupriavidus sp.]|nr:hypothetical protein [Cupriavidus sp.]
MGVSRACLSRQADVMRCPSPAQRGRGAKTVISHFKTILASLQGLAVRLVLSAAPRLARTAS